MLAQFGSRASSIGLFQILAMPIRALFAFAVILMPGVALAHGFAGKRYFPPTIEIEDPFAADEMHLFAGKRPARDGPGSRRASVLSVGASTELFDGFGVGIQSEYRAPNENLGPVRNGADNVSVLIKKELQIDDRNEWAVTAALGVELGGTGAAGASRATIFSPSVFYAKGFGNLAPEQWRWRPFALTGVLALDSATDRQQPMMLRWGFTVQYSLLYLQTHVRDLALSAPFDRMVPVIEVPLRTCLNNACSGKTYGSVNPGVIWVGPTFNLAFSLVLPINTASGRGVGALLQFQKYLLPH